MQRLDPDLRALQEVRTLVTRAKDAAKLAAGWDQVKTDAVTRAMAEAAEAAAHDLARMAVEETGIGRVHYKVLKNLFASRGIWESIKAEKTVGVIARDDATGLREIATPVGVVAGIIPTTNPTSTAIGKALIAVKGRNGIVFSPHPRSKKCIAATVELLRRAIERAGGPPDLVASLASPTIESTGALMKHPDVSVILATGGSGLVRAAYSSGKPAYGVGPGNVPCYIDRSADLVHAAKAIVSSQSFDNATLCCSEQALVLDAPIADRFLAEMKARGAHMCCPEETVKLGLHCNKGGHMNPDVVGLDPWRVAEGAGFSVPRATSVLLAHQDGVGAAYPLSIEILCPVLSIHLVDGWREGCKVSMQVLHFDGLGHTCGVHATDERVLEAWFLEKPANRILANGPCSQGAVGYSTQLVPSMSLGCGPQAGNITSDNITVRHLLNIKRVAFPRADWEQRELRDHARAAELTGEHAPRGSGLPGDPSTGSAAARPSSSAFDSRSAPASNWRGNPALVVGPERGNGASRAPAPIFGTPAKSKVLAAPKSPAAATNISRPPASNVGGSLTSVEIENIMAHAGEGCPLGPCKGCPHRNVETGACMA